MDKNTEHGNVYQMIIDSLVKESNSISSRLIVENGMFSKARGKDKYNTFVSSLDDEQKILLSEMINSERVSAIHDVLANLSWWIDCEEVSLCHKGKPMKVDFSGMGLHGDYIGRLDDWEWTEE